ncbi:MAG TPA: plastocyanin/azurin family copper-binding protein [Candidatus Methylomirabilis sp.]|nr:plastocyanin/azurin family copper-binding protein [Candidatus Methylomirabilis sp.]
MKWVWQWPSWWGCRRPWWIIACALTVLVVVVGSAAGPGWGSDSVGRKEAAVAIKTFQFNPDRLEVKTGTRITWMNQDEVLHTVTSGTPETRDGRFGSPLDGKGATTSVTLTEPGTYPYFCERHQSMQGEIRVQQ